MVLWRVSSKGADSITVNEFLYCYKPYQIAVSLGCWNMNNRKKGIKLVMGLPTSNRESGKTITFLCVERTGRVFHGKRWTTLLLGFDELRGPLHLLVCACVFPHRSDVQFCYYRQCLLLPTNPFFLFCYNSQTSQIRSKRVKQGASGVVPQGSSLQKILFNLKFSLYIHSAQNRTRLFYRYKKPTKRIGILVKLFVSILFWKTFWGHFLGRRDGYCQDEQRKAEEDDGAKGCCSN